MELADHEERYRARLQDNQERARQMQIDNVRDRKERFRNMSWKPANKIDDPALTVAKEKELERVQIVKEHTEKVGNYAKYVKEMYWPKASVKK